MIIVITNKRGLLVHPLQQTSRLEILPRAAPGPGEDFALGLRYFTAPTHNTPDGWAFNFVHGVSLPFLSATQPPLEGLRKVADALLQIGPDGKVLGEAERVFGLLRNQEQSVEQSVFDQAWKDLSRLFRLYRLLCQRILEQAEGTVPLEEPLKYVLRIDLLTGGGRAG